MVRCNIASVTRSLALLLVLLAAACGGGGIGGTPAPIPPVAPTFHTVGGTVSGILGTGMVLTNNGGDNLAINADGGFTFSTSLLRGFTYSVSVQTQPSAPAQLCAVTNAGGTVGGNVTNVQVVCRNSIGGTVTGQIGTLVLRNNGGDSKAISSGGGTASFTFATAINNGSAYSVTVFSTTPAQQCIVTNGSGTANGNVTDVQVACKSTVGGAVTGLVGTVVLQNNGGDNLSPSASGPFTFPTALPTGSSYVVTVFALPAGQTCFITGNGSGLALGSVSNVEVSCANGQWTWESGSSTSNQPGVYGTKGTAAAGNAPGSRDGAVSWIDGSGDLWLFGGFGFDSTGATSAKLNDLWKYNINTLQWTWVSGSNANSEKGTYGVKGTPAAGNVPGARERAVSWFDGSGNLWLFGGTGIDVSGVSGDLNDLWKYNISLDQWTWVSGGNAIAQVGVYGVKGTAAPGNVPGSRSKAVSWFDAPNSLLWLFGGFGQDSDVNLGQLNDLWKYDINLNQWIWVSGTDTPPSEPGVYGTKGVAAPTNVPGGREGAVSWRDSGGNLWLFGGTGRAFGATLGTLNDLWKFNGTQWTRKSGANVIQQSGTYGTMGVAAVANVPGAREEAISWTDSTGNLWLFGGNSGGTLFSDLWKYNIAIGQWTWMNGSKLANQPVTHGTLGAAGTGLPGSRLSAVSWIDASGNLRLFGGWNGSYLNDLWRHH